MKAKILVVEDSLDVRTLMEIYLEEEGYTVLSASNGLEAINLALHNQPDLVLLDMQVSGLNGYEVVKQLRMQHFSQPIVALSASPLPQDEYYASTVGCNHYLIKPVSSETLLKTVVYLLKTAQNLHKL